MGRPLGWAAAVGAGALSAWSGKVSTGAGAAGGRSVRHNCSTHHRSPPPLLTVLQVRAVCPYQGVRPAAYPPTLLTCSQADLRVPFWGPLKFVARVRAAVAAHAPPASLGGDAASSGDAVASGGGASTRHGDRGPILLRPDGQAGHFVHDRDLHATKAEHYAFLAVALDEQQAA